VKKPQRIGISSINPTRFTAVWTPLRDDILVCIESLEKDFTNQFWARTLVRTLFTFVEATTYELKLAVLQAAEIGSLDLVLSERVALEDSVYELDNSGKVVARPRFLAAERQMRFVFGLMVRIVGSDAEMPVGDAAYAQFKRALRVRNRLMHPKDPADLTVTQDEIWDAIDGFHWYFRALDRLTKRWLDELERFIKEAEAYLAKSGA
jgi:hypothetical protein